MVAWTAAPKATALSVLISAAEVRFSAELRIFLRTLNRTFFRFTDSAEPEPNARELVQFRFEPSSERELTVVLASSRFSVAFAEVSVEAKPDPGTEMPLHSSDSPSMSASDAAAIDKLSASAFLS